MEVLLKILNLPWISNEGLLLVAVVMLCFGRYVTQSCSYHLYWLSTSTSFRRKRKTEFPFHIRIRLSYYEPCIKYHVRIYRNLMWINVVNWGLLIGFLLSYLLACISIKMRIVLLLFFYFISLMGVGLAFFSIVNTGWDKKRGGVNWKFDNPSHKR